MEEKDWKDKLTEMQFYVLREKGTEAPFSGLYNDFFEKGDYHCVGCGQVLFKSDQKFPSSCGWPSYDSCNPGAIEEVMDYSHHMIRKEIVCSQCKGHIGHVFDDGPTATGLRFCVNSVAVEFQK